MAISLPLTASYILHLEHYDGGTAMEAFGPVTGLVYTGRSLIENLALGVVGISGVKCPVWLVALCVAVLLISGIFCWRAVWTSVATRRLLALGAGMIVLSYWLVYSARATWTYEGVMNQPAWNRYHLLPHLGLVLLLTGALPRWNGRWFLLDTRGSISRRQAQAIVALIGILLLIQLPRGLLAHRWFDPGPQREVLRQVEDVDARCCADHISADAARSVLGWLEIPLCGNRKNGWDLLHGSDTPRQLPREEIGRLLAPALPKQD